MDITQEARQLFMKYALPCAGTLVRRGSLKQEELDSLLRAVKDNGEIPANAERIFKVAFSACSLLAIDTGKKDIDEEIIHQYYLYEHDKMIDKRYDEMGDFDQESCRIRPGTVLSTYNGSAVVENSAGVRGYRTDYCNVKEGDIVVTHWDFVVEKVPRLIAEEMQQQKIILRVV